MKKIGVLSMVVVGLILLVGCDKHLETKQTSVQGIVTSDKVEKVFDEVETKKIKDKNGKIITQKVDDYDDILTIEVEYTHKGESLNDSIELDLDDDKNLVKIYNQFNEGQPMPCILNENIFKEKDSGKIYSDFSIDIDEEKIKNN